MQTADPLILTKLRIPPIRPRLAPGPRLQEQILRGLQNPLTVVTTPAGFGKTTLVASCVIDCGIRAAWLSLDKNDNDAGRFLMYFLLVHFQEPQVVKKEFWHGRDDIGGMFGKGSGWAIPFGTHTLDVALGGIAEKPGVIDGRIEIREYLCLTLCFDHDIIDGAPAARFTQRFKELIESGYGLMDPSAERGSIPAYSFA